MGYLQRFSETAFPSQAVIYIDCSGSLSFYGFVRQLLLSITKLGNHIMSTTNGHSLLANGNSISKVSVTKTLAEFAFNTTYKDLTPALIDAQFSNYIQTAISWLHSNQMGWGVYDKIFDEEIQELASRVEHVIDPSLPVCGTK